MANSKIKLRPQVAVVMGSQSDWKIMKDCVDLLKEFKIPFSKQIISAHRTPEEMFRFASSAHLQGLRVIIAGAGGAAHLPGMIASISPLPVIGVPVKTTRMEGLDSLLSIVQMPKGVPVASVAIDNAYNAALLAIQILASQGDQKSLQKLLDYKMKLRKKVLRQRLPKS